MLQMRSIMTLLVAAICLESCTHLPSPPSGFTCVVDVSLGGADCVPITTAVRDAGDIRKMRLHTDTFVPFNQMDNYIAFSPDTWGNIQVYIGDLKALANRSCQFSQEVEKK